MARLTGEAHVPAPVPEDDKPQAEVRGGDRPADYIPDSDKWSAMHLTEEYYDEDDE